MNDYNEYDAALLARLSGPAFEQLGQSNLQALLNGAETIELQAGECLAEKGACLDAPFVLIDGTVELAGGSAGQDVIAAPAFIGEPGLLDDPVWPTRVVAKGACHLLRLDLASVRKAIFAAPAAFEDHPTFGQIARQQDHIAQALANGSALSDVGEDVQAAMICSLGLRFFPGGSVVMRKGDESRFALIVVMGLLRVSVAGAEGEGRTLFGNYVQGASVGEIGLILGQSRSADVVAARDTVAAVLERRIWDRIVTLDPVKVSRAASKLVHDHMSPAKLRSDVRTARAISVVPSSPNTDTDWLCQALCDALSAYGKTRLLRSEDSCTESLPTNAGALARVEQMSRFAIGADFIVLQADAESTGWSQLCLRQVDHILFAVSDDIAERDHWIKPVLKDAHTESMIDQWVVEIHPANGAASACGYALPDWALSNEHFNIRKGRDGDVARLARMLVGRGVGLVLGGGGARGFAHLGVMRALNEANLPVDLIGGNSMGALLGAQIALEKPLDVILSDTRAFAKGGERPTLPIVSLVGGHKLRAGIRDLLGDGLIENLWREFFSVSCNLSTADVTVLDRGPLWQAVLASNSPAGIAPPTLRNGHLLVDGAILNNLPVDVMRARIRQGIVLGVDVNPRDKMLVPAELQTLSPLSVLRQRFGFASSAPLPGISEILQRAGTIGGMSHRKRVRGLTDFVIEPQVQEFSLIGYGRASEIEAAGYRSAMENMDKIEQALRPHVGT